MGTLRPALGMTPGSTFLVSFLKEKPGKTPNMGVEELDSALSLITNVLVFPLSPNKQMGLLRGHVKQWGQEDLGTNPAWANHSISPSLSFLISKMWEGTPACGWLF